MSGAEQEGEKKTGLFLLFIVKKNSSFYNMKFAFHGRVSVLGFESKELPMGSGRK